MLPIHKSRNLILPASSTHGATTAHAAAAHASTSSHASHHTHHAHHHRVDAHLLHHGHLHGIIASATSRRALGLLELDLEVLAVNFMSVHGLDGLLCCDGVVKAHKTEALAGTGCAVLVDGGRHDGPKWRKAEANVVIAPSGWHMVDEEVAALGPSLGVAAAAAAAAAHAARVVRSPAFGVIVACELHHLITHLLQFHGLLRGVVISRSSVHHALQNFLQVVHPGLTLRSIAHGNLHAAPIERIHLCTIELG
mmetsp:Transcript_28645/g.46041  ORF Transcript_28645/g.46041 Transcript_28645/m.46041 type:complete len:252 (+) Transcript_28645:670-1425(+)